ncbi:uncharacterized protein [Eleutherodactylus coqui]|uniref:uncharacterized protein isoform X2 n=1 Tax=Eleutherodactylus coqui TaxID=57060 RepID=UPI003462178E
MELSRSLCIQIVTSTIWLGLGIALIVMGAIYKDDCPIQPYIPIFLLVTGVIHLMAVLIHFLKCVLETCGMVLQGIIGMFGFAWFVVGLNDKPDTKKECEAIITRKLTRLYETNGNAIQILESFRSENIKEICNKFNI